MTIASVSPANRIRGLDMINRINISSIMAGIISLGYPEVNQDLIYPKDDSSGE
jgi:hypothetical protein